MSRIDCKDEQTVDFSRTGLALKRWEDAVDTAVKGLSGEADRLAMREALDWQSLHANIQKLAADTKTLPAARRLLNHLHPLPRTLEVLTQMFSKAISPRKTDFSVLYGLVYLNIKISANSTEKLVRMATWLKKMRNKVEILNRCLNLCSDPNEARIVTCDVFDSMLLAFVDALRHLRIFPKDADFSQEWKKLELNLTGNLLGIEAAVAHLHEIAAHSMANLERQVEHISIGHAPAPQPEEYAKFPIMMLPRGPNRNFYGRQEELERINQYLDHRGNMQLRIYTIYGKCGVGKTDIARQYAYKNPCGFEAIFWVQCETSLSLRQSFTDMAVALNLPGSDRNGHHENNQLIMLKWLKTTARSWLMIFDNAGGQGAILVTSRKYCNFMKENRRRGNTVKAFNLDQRWDFFIKLLGSEWQDLDRNGLIKESEEQAAKGLLQNISGLALAIQQAATLIGDLDIGGPDIASTYESFKERAKGLPRRLTGKRSEIIHSIDTLFNMTFTHLPRNARDLLSILALLSPDSILLDLFLPRNQNALNGKLAFCKQPSSFVDDVSQAALSTIITPPLAFRAAIDELLRFRLIRQEGRELGVHRVVQEAMNHHSFHELQESFDSASRLVYEVFPKQLHDNFLHERSTCQSYISHAVHLSILRSQLVPRGAPLKGSLCFVDLISNCAWYLYEVGDYDMSLQLVESATSACENKMSLSYATLCNVAGGAYYELNKLGNCRKYWEEMRDIQHSLSLTDDLNRSTSYHVMGNLESACGNLHEAMIYFNNAVLIRLAARDSAASLLANTYLCIARVYYLKGEYDEAYRICAQSEALFVRSLGNDNYFLANVHYLYGNIEFAQDKWDHAKRCWEYGLKICLNSMPIHPITAAAYYSLGCVKFELKNHDNARDLLDKAMAIAQLRSPNRDDGTIARILWKQSKVMEDDVYGTCAEQAKQLRDRAEAARDALVIDGEGIFIDYEGNQDGTEEDSYDALVPGYFR